MKKLKFKAGDKVRVTKRSISGHGFKRGDIITIDRVDHSDTEIPYFSDGYWVSEEEVEPVKKLKFKAGDKVRIVKNCSGHDFKIGDIVEIELVDNSYCTKIPYCSGGYWFSEEEVEAVKKFKFKVGDKVRVIKTGDALWGHSHPVGFEFEIQDVDGDSKDTMPYYSGEYWLMEKEIELVKTETKTNKMKDFAIVSNSTALLKAFTQEANAMGWRRNAKFNNNKPLTELFHDVVFGNNFSCLFFGEGWSMTNGVFEGCGWAASNYSGDIKVFNLNTQWDEAVKYAKEYLEHKQIKTLELTKDYTAKIDMKNKVVVVGCQTIPFSKVDELHHMIFYK